MSLKIVISIETSETGYEKIAAQTISDESTIDSERYTARQIHELITKGLMNEAIYYESRKDVL